MFTRLFKDLYAYRDLLFALTSRDIRVRYKQAAMGILWAFFLPLLAILSGVIIRLAMAHLQGSELQLANVSSVMVRSVIWLLFASAVGTSAVSLISNMNLVTKIYFPREILPISGMLARLFDFAISVVGVIVGLIILTLVSSNDSIAVTITPTLLLVPLLVLVVIFMIVGIGLALASANIFFRDVKYIVEVLLRFGIFFSGVMIFVGDLPPSVQPYFLCNPLVPLMEAISGAVVYGQIDPTLWPWLGYSVIVTICLCWIGVASFRRGEHLFAEYA